MTRAPLRFLLAVLVLWIGVRAAILLPGGPGGVNPVQVAATAPQPALPDGPSPLPAPVDVEAAPPAPPVIGPEFWSKLLERPVRTQLLLAAAPPIPPEPAPQRELPGAPASLPAKSQQPPLLPPQPHPLPVTASRWSASAWLLIRSNDAGPSLAPGGTLGGSQAGARVTYALGGGFSFSGRAYLPLRQTAGAELAAGIDWRPVPSLPLNLLAERRQRLGRDGRNAFALTLYGGASRTVAPRLRLDLYGQAGVVGLSSRDLFVDGSLRVARRVGPVELGAGAWGAAQRGAARLDAGPSLSWRLPVPDTNLRLQADWRFRVAGDAAPHSGPALTLAADF